MARLREKLIAVIGADFDQAYSGTQYLLEYLNATFDVHAYVFANARHRQWYAQLPFRCHVMAFHDKRWHGWHARLMFRLFRLGMQVRMLFAHRVLITDAFCLREAARAKKVKGHRMVLVQFCQELALPEDYPDEKWPRVQKQSAQVPDIVIDVDPLRAKARMSYYGLAHMPYVLRNTFPRSRMPPRAAPGRLWSLAGIPPPMSGVPVLVHAGGVGREKPFERIIDAVAVVKVPVYLLAFCMTSAEKLQNLREYARQKLSPDSFHFCQSVTREELRGSLWEADIGVVDYAFSVEPTVNQRYCAPTKLYEFMACGLAVVGSDNESLRNIIEAEGLGRCARGDAPRDLAQALTEMIRTGVEKMRYNAETAFAMRYSYEAICADVVQRVAAEIQSIFSQRNVQNSQPD